MLKIDFYKNKNSNSTNYGKIYGRAKNDKPINIDALAEHIADHGSVYTVDVVKGVLTKVAKCIKELVLIGTPVKIDDLCIFKGAVTSKPANDVETYDLNTHIKTVRMLMTATGASTPVEMTKSATLGYTSMAQRIKTGEAVLSGNKKEYLVAGSGSGSGVPSVNP